MKSKEEITKRFSERQYILMFMEEVEQVDTFWLWHKYSVMHPAEKSKWEYHFRMFSSAAFHATLLSSRKLNDFFTGGEGRLDDIKADRYGFQNMAAPLSKASLTKLNKYLAHMTIPGSDMALGDWDTNEFLRPILLRACEFCIQLEKEFLDPKMDRELIEKVASFKKGLLLRIKRTNSASGVK